jgi:ribokinase
MRESDVDAVAGLLAGSDVLVAQLEVPLEVVVRAVDLCGPETHVLLNAAPWRRVPASVLERVDTLVVNEDEAASLVGSPVDGADGARRAVTTILSHGPRAVVVTLGVHGAVVADSGGCTHLPAPRISVVDTTGAGDVFVGSLAALLADGRPLQEAAAIAVERASASVAFVGARAPLGTS